jgi:hypothetical protein
MAVEIIKIAGRKYAVMPYSEYEKLSQKKKRETSKPRIRVTKSSRMTAEDRADIAAAKRSLAGKGKYIPWEQVKKELGL